MAKYFFRFFKSRFLKKYIWSLFWNGKSPDREKEKLGFFLNDLLRDIKENL